MNSKQPQKRYSQKTWLPLGLIQESLEFKWEKSLLFYCRLKNLHKKPIIYNFSLRKVASLMGCSVFCAKSHIDTLKEKNLIKTSGKHLTIIGVNKLKELTKKRRFLVPVEHQEKPDDHMAAMLFTVIKRNLHLQLSEIDKAVQIILLQENILDDSLNNKEDIKRILKMETNLRSKGIKEPERLLDISTHLSNEKIGALCFRSQLFGLRLQKKLNNLGYIKSYKRIRLSGETMTKELFKQREKFADDDLLIGKNGKLFTQQTNLIFLNDGTDLTSKIKNLYKVNEDAYLFRLYESKNLIVEKERTMKPNNGKSLLRNSLITKHENKIKVKELDDKFGLSDTRCLPAIKLTKSQKALNTIFERYGDDPARLGYILYIREKIIKKWKDDKRKENEALRAKRRENEKILLSQSL